MLPGLILLKNRFKTKTIFVLFPFFAEALTSTKEEVWLLKVMDICGGQNQFHLSVI